MAEEKNPMLPKEIRVYSEKHHIHGTIKDYGFVTKLVFAFEGKEIEMGITRNIFSGETFEEVGRDIIDSYIDNLAKRDGNRRLMYHYWYVDIREYSGKPFKIGHGVVTGHERLADSVFSHSSEVKAIHIDEDREEAVLTTRNSVYHCPLAYCDFKEQEKFPDIIPDYEKIKKKYEGKLDNPTIEPGKVLLVLANFCEYYFHSICYIPRDSKDKKPLEWLKWAHVGMFQDSYLISVKGTRIDLRYFPHFQNIEFYSTKTEDMPLYLENIGDVTLYAKTDCGTIRLEPGDRKEVSEENVETERPILPSGDLYPAAIIEGDISNELSDGKRNV